MSKLVFIGFGALGVGATGVGGFLLLKGNKVTFEERYKHALLSKNSNLWDSKFTALKSGTPVHHKLIEAVNKSKENNQDTVGKSLMQEGCELIYKEYLENSKYLNDFTKYCSKTNKEAGTGNWNSDDKSNTSWDSSLDALKIHDVSKYGELDSQLSALKSELSSKSTPYDALIREKMKLWCEGIQANIFEGSESKEFKQQEKYCRKV